jgi:hypothetical protein
MKKMAKDEAMVKGPAGLSSKKVNRAMLKDVPADQKASPLTE